MMEIFKTRSCVIVDNMALVSRYLFSSSFNEYKFIRVSVIEEDGVLWKSVINYARNSIFGFLIFHFSAVARILSLGRHRRDILCVF